MTFNIHQLLGAHPELKSWFSECVFNCESQIKLLIVVLLLLPMFKCLRISNWTSQWEGWRIPQGEVTKEGWTALHVWTSQWEGWWIPQGEVTKEGWTALHVWTTVENDGWVCESSGVKYRV